MPEVSYVEAIRRTLAEEMRANERILLLGQDIGAWGGLFGATKGLRDEFGAERVRDTPVSELSVVGAGVGAAMAGYRPVVELQSLDFMTLAMDQIVNQAAKMHYMSGGQATVPLLLRAAAGGGLGLGAQHSQMLESWAVHVPGLLVAMPSTPRDVCGLLRTTLRQEQNPVLFIEHKLLYSTRGEVPAEDYTIPLGAAALRRHGRHVTVVSYGRMANIALAACEQAARDHGIECDMIDLCTLQPLDLVAVLESVRKTGRVLLCSEAPRTGNFVCELAMRINEQAFDDLDAPMRRVCGENVPLPASAPLEAAAVPSQDAIAKAIYALRKE